MLKLTPELTKAIGFRLAKGRGVAIHYKPDSKLMWSIGWIVGTVTKISHKQFMRDYSTSWQQSIYLKYKLGNGEYNYLSQLSHLGHELTHTDQDAADPSFLILYLGESSRTALYEAQALCVNLECSYLYVDKDMDWDAKITKYANRLDKYRCSKEDIRAAKSYMTSFMATLTSVNCPVTDVGISLQKVMKEFGVL